MIVFQETSPSRLAA